MTTRSSSTLVAFLLLLVGCRDWPPETAPTPDPWTLRVDPPIREGLADPVVQLSIVGAARAISPEEVWVVEGQISSAQLSALQRGEPSKAFLERRVPARAFTQGDDLVVAPERALSPGVVTVASAEPRWTASFDVGEQGAFPLLVRAWPPAGAPGQPSAWVFCGEAVAGEPAETRLAPAGVSGAFEPWIDPRCVRFNGGRLDAGFVVPPPWIVCDGTPCALEPGALVAAPEAAPAARVCEAGEISFGLGCATVADDRLVVRAPPAPLFWVVAVDGAELLSSSPRSADARFVIRGLTPSTDVSLVVRTLDVSGVERVDLVQVSTTSAQPHVVLSEVYANPIGAEPTQEWIELENDGAANVSLAGSRLEDAGGEAVLPDVVLPPGGFVVLATHELELDDGFDAPIPVGCTVVRLEALGKNGLSNSGEPLTLTGPSGEIWSRFRPLSASDPGESAIRTAPDAFDDDANAFAITAQVTPCAPNVLSED